MMGEDMMAPVPGDRDPPTSLPPAADRSSALHTPVAP
jgi:hypothetical protein